MRKKNVVLRPILIILLPIIIIIISCNIVLRLSPTYIYYFNDTQVSDKLYTDIKDETFAENITGYLNSLGSEKFQVYEDNGKYKDPIFSEKDSRIMSRLRIYLNFSLIIAVLLLACALSIYRTFIKKQRGHYIEGLSYGIGATTVIGVVMINLILRIKVSSLWVYNLFIGVKPEKNSSLAVLLGGEFINNFLLFFTITSIFLLAICVYINYHFAKKGKIFF